MQNETDFLERATLSSKKELRTNALLSSSKKRPPKLQNKRDYSKRLFSDKPVAKPLIENHNTTLELSKIYNDSLGASYYEQLFEPVMKLGEGSFGEVYKVRSKEDGRFYAVKITKESFRSSTDRQEKIAEVRKHALIPKQENCISLIQAWEEEGHVYHQMELGCMSLDIYARHNPDIAEGLLWNILLDMLLALKNLHDNKLIHLDVKLENIIICENGSCKLGDFGLMMDLKDDLRDAVEGDAKYLAPELMEGTFTEAADIFSLGISMLELATDKQLPTNGKLWHDLRDGLCYASFQDKIPSELFALIKKMMLKDYRQRPTVNQLLKHSRLKLMLRNRRDGKENRISLEECFTPIIITSTPIPPTDRPSTPPNNGLDSPTINFIPATPTGVLNTSSLNGSFLGSIDNSPKLLISSARKMLSF